MKVRVTSGLPNVRIGSSTITGRELTGFSDNVGYAAYEIVVKAGESVCFVSPFGDDYNHIYYCFNGSGEANCGDANIAFSTATMVALSGKMELKVAASTEMRIFATYVKASPDTSITPSVPLTRTLAELVGGERDIDWTRGRSRRFLLRRDGFNISMTSTLVFPDQTAAMQYNNNYEIAYYIRGDVTYSWNDRAESHHFKQTSPAKVDGCTFIMDQHDAHVLESGPVESEVICLFYPPLEGTETHDFSKGGSSSY